VFDAKHVTMAGKRLVQLWQDRGNGNPQPALDSERYRQGMEELCTHGNDAVRSCDLK